jgi:trehalose-phosphatase
VAAKWILQASGWADALPICLGDDATDEDAFAALAGGITIRIGRPVKTAARYQLKCQGMVQRFLAWLADTEAGVTKT